MHPEAWDWVAKFSTDEPLAVLDIGGRNVNGSTRDLFPNAAYLVVDLIGTADVDIVADAADWTPGRLFDLVVCTEVFEHTSRWVELCVTAKRALRPDGLFLITCAGPGRAPHSGFDGEAVRAGEHYENIVPAELELILRRLSFAAVEVYDRGQDLQAVAHRGRRV